MKGGVEAGDLRKFRSVGEKRAYRGQIVRLVQRRETGVSLEPAQHLRIDEHGTVVLRAAVHDAMADRTWLDAKLIAQPCRGYAERVRDVADDLGWIAAVDQRAAVRTECPQLRPAADAVHLPLEPALGALIAGDIEHLKLDAR